jgi:hypothetical protein
MDVRAQGARNTAAQPPATTVAAAPANDNTKRAMTIADIGKWRTIRDVAISDDGQWASYGYQQRRVDDTLFVKQLPAGAEQIRVRRGRDSRRLKWIAYFVAEPIRPNGQPPQPSPDGDRPGRAGGSAAHPRHRRGGVVGQCGVVRILWSIR